MPAIRNTKKSLVEHLSLKQESMKDKLLLEKIGMDPTPSTKLYDKLIKANSYWYEVEVGILPPRTTFLQKQEIIMHKGVQRTPGTYLGSDITIFH